MKFSSPFWFSCVGLRTMYAPGVGLVSYVFLDHYKRGAGFGTILSVTEIPMCHEIGDSLMLLSIIVFPMGE